MAVECKTANQRLVQFLSRLHDPVTLLQCVCERALLRTLQGGCSAPVAVDSQVGEGKVSWHELFHFALKELGLIHSCLAADFMKLGQTWHCA